MIVHFVILFFVLMPFIVPILCVFQTSSGADANRHDLLWLWKAVDAVFPSIYPRTWNITIEADSVEDSVRGALLTAELTQNVTANETGGAHRPAVFPYARALVAPGNISMHG